MAIRAVAGQFSWESLISGPPFWGFSDSLCYNLIHRAGTDALVTFSHGVHGVRFASTF
jgi:hypothetical protein